jgi:endonuclease/exonuclease/phosphatase family metal-dependent hydrolase
MAARHGGWPMVAVITTVAAGGCGHGPVLAAEPRIPPCRQLVALDGGADLPAVRWFGPGQDDEVVRHYRWCRAAGPLAVFRPLAVSASAADSLAIVSFNVNLGAAPLAEFVDSLRAGAFSGGVPVPDFVLLVQETFREGDAVPGQVARGSGTGRSRFPVPRAGRRLDAARVADSLRLHLFYVPSMRSGRGRNPNGQGEDRGNAIFATRPLSDLAVVELPFFGQRRAAQLARIRGTSSTGRPWSVQVANVHFDVGRVGPSALSAGRARQARAMAQVVDSAGAVVLGGDLNAFSLLGTAESVQILQAAFPQTVQADELPTRGGQRLDYLFFRLPPGYQAAPYRRVPATFGSDHHPVMGWVRFE